MASRRSNGRLFDQIIVVDWSANSSPKLGADSIWMAVVEQADAAQDAQQDVRVDNLPTRRAALAAIAEFASTGRHTLVGVDFSLGFPTGTAEALGLTGTAWEATWQMLGSMISDDDRNANNRFEVATQLNAAISDGAGPFWGCPSSQANAVLTTTRPEPRPSWPPVWRHTEVALRDRGHRPFSAWQLHGAGSVGSQSLVGIAALERLRWNLGERMSIWPYTTGLRPPDGTGLVVAEVWPSLWPVEVPTGVIKDAAQVEATARRLAAMDCVGDLAGCLAPAVASDVCGEVVTEEGWVLGVGIGGSERSV